MLVSPTRACKWAFSTVQQSLLTTFNIPELSEPLDRKVIFHFNLILVSQKPGLSNTDRNTL